ncbi:DUF4832 domain-containing protein [Neobacillus kokaensis]|uniref:F5/8 type C domain-containing protein n=1 Tax=Neobacillus kokaensis TaxID=2759023 RepID=A0ABQ3N5J1_9BACI|nr:DUF4832 domain-containing protein [Neobacillus kokaensis]GHH99939.1 hypothetical protein AM1BK_34820 [Neobacillus kokaensis]
MSIISPISRVAFGSEEGNDINASHNVALQAIASTTAPTGQNDISNIIDGNDQFGWASSDHQLPQFIELDFGFKTVKTDKISLLSNYGPGQGITKLNIEYFDGISWKIARQDVIIDWKKNEQTAETIDITFPVVEAKKIRLNVKGANLKWAGFAILELKVWGVILLTTADVASSITTIEQPSRSQTNLALPKVPDGYSVSIFSSDNESVIAVDGTIRPQQSDTNVSITLEILNESDHSKAVTSPVNVMVPGVPPSNYVKVVPKEDETSIIKNPAMGWVVYLEEFGSPFPDAKTFWNQVDPYLEPASILYIRVPWSRLEPTEGHYAWNEDENYQKLIQMALDRGLKLAFRVFVDSQDSHMQATPQFVFDGGAGGYGAQSNPDYKTPYVNDPVFRKKFENFIKAFGKQYDDPQVVDYIDGQGLGWWGEMHNMGYLNTYEKQKDTLEWITNLYSSNFQKVLLGLQYGGNQFNYSLQDWAIQSKGYMIRRDSLGSIQWFPQADKDKINLHWPKVPVFAENCYQNFVSRPNACDGYTRPIHDMLSRVVNDAIEIHANTLDLRHPEDVQEWVTNNYDLVQKFAINGGYRFVLNDVSYPNKMTSGKKYNIYYSWKNTAVGKLPNDLPNWNHKYKVSFALLNKKTGVPVYQSIHSPEPSNWIKGKNFDYIEALDLEGVKNGTYNLAVAIVNSENKNNPEINLAIKNDKTKAGWYEIGKVVINNSRH